MMILVIIGMSVACANETTTYEQLSPEFMDSKVVLAADTHNHYDESIGPGSAWWVRAYNYQSGTGFYGDFTTTGNDISFFLVDEENFNLWYDGESFYSKKSAHDVYSGSYEYKSTTSGDYYFIFSNRDAFFWTTTLSFDFYVDKTPPAFSVNLNSGTTYSDIKVITVSATDTKFDVGSIKLYVDSVLKKTEYDGSFSYNWDTRDYANNQHTIRVTVSDNVGNSDYREYIVNVNNYLPATTDSTTSGPSGATNPAPLGISSIIPIGLGLVGLVGVIGVVFVVRGKGKSSPPGVVVPIPAQEPPSDDIVESYSQSKTASTPTQVVCPFCGSRTQAGLAKCQLCGADL